MTVDVSATSAAPDSTANRTTRRGGMRPEIQGLRALAVALVVLYHVWPDRLTGGFVGVDVFFVISGFLITAHLAKEVAATGSVRIGQFWARRIRRLLPASLLVLLVSAIAVLTLVSQAYWLQYLREIVASTLYVQNWELASSAVDYLAAENTASPVQHFWSLSTEEQFYLVWPVLIVGAVWLANRTGRVSARLAMRVVLGVILAASLVWSIAQVASDPAVAYFSTFVRAWEFAAGGLLGLFTAPVWRSVGWQRAASWAGFAMILVTAFTYTSATPFPGASAVLPVAGTVLVIAAGHADGALGTAHLYRWRPVQYVGDISYSVYLWHWPLIVLLPLVLDRELTGADKLALLAATLVLASLTKHLVEDRLRLNKLTSRRSVAVTFAATVVGMGAVIAPAAYGISTMNSQVAELEAERAAVEASIEDAAQTGAESETCVGAQALDGDATCVTDQQRELIPAPAVASEDIPELYTDECRTDMPEVTIKPCRFGDPDGSVTAVLIGDSHSASWFPAVKLVAEKRGWDLTVYFKAGCAWNAASQEWDETVQRTSCAQWNEDVTDRLLADPPQLIVTSALFDDQWGDGAVAAQIAIDGFATSWSALAEAGSTVLPIVDTPQTSVEAQECLLAGQPGALDCGTPRATALDRPDVMSLAAAEVPGVEAVDLNDYFCTADFCPSAIGSITVYRDRGHLTQTYATTLAPYLDERITDTLGASVR
ncbi:acyltransferase family protein [Demequina sp. SYSU T00192]|uniref:Acyltransferase family protein n=1 Tax=Demequina litoralis TaxID=3051660 RepID=A0ABT8G6X7_9MICO|nr:acyltransferase family protein [Demequina sp. SYSU T00192]MDN4474439.1 acyltransferase family protein [Demequina sp. SYSU T00192]